MTTIPKTEIRRMKECQNAMSTVGYMLAKPRAFKMALEQGFVESNAHIANGEEIAFRITDKGMVYLVGDEALDVLGEDENGTAPENETQATPTNVDFPIDTNAAADIVVNTQTATAPNTTQNEGKTKMSYEIVNVGNIEDFAKRTRESAPKYPFADLEVGQGFPVYPTEDMPEPWKSLQSTVSTASKRYATVIGQETNENGKVRNKYDYDRKFAVKRVKAEDGTSYAMVARII